MVDLIEFSTCQAEPDWRPYPGDRYQAYGLAKERDPVTLTFIFAGGLRGSFPYGRMGLVQFKPFDGDAIGIGEDHLSAFFDMTPGTGLLVDVFGRDLSECASAMSNRRLGWVRALPRDGAVAEGSPVVRHIEYQRAKSSDLFDLMSLGSVCGKVR